MTQLAFNFLSMYEHAGPDILSAALDMIAPSTMIELMECYGADTKEELIKHIGERQ